MGIIKEKERGLTPCKMQDFTKADGECKGKGGWAHAVPAAWVRARAAARRRDGCRHKARAEITACLFRPPVYPVGRTARRTVSSNNHFAIWSRIVTPESAPSLCSICDRQETGSRQEDGLCHYCASLAQAVQEQPEVIKRLWLRHHNEPILPEPGRRPIESEAELPEVLDGKRYRTIDRDRNK